MLCHEMNDHVVHEGPDIFYGCLRGLHLTWSDPQGFGNFSDDDLADGGAVGSGGGGHGVSPVERRLYLSMGERFGQYRAPSRGFLSTAKILLRLGEYEVKIAGAPSRKGGCACGWGGLW